ncbi:NAD(P)H-dependent oxidoreductase [Aeromicrobium alkaliterrae]|uniref:NAD(P)H-dependent oxidoreductase n=1 Tax=Aeromicrobium alkaliterrae TaxID=302168 RepID=A0ABP4VSS7_9ACTN
MDIAVVIGHPRPQSRTRTAALAIANQLAERVGGTVTEIDVLGLGPALLELGDASVARTVERLARADVAVVVSPTFKGSYSGLLKLFLDHVPAAGLGGVVALPLMVGGNPDHADAPERLLRPLLLETGASCPVPGHYLLDSDLDGATVPDGWAEVLA